MANTKLMKDKMHELMEERECIITTVSDEVRGFTSEERNKKSELEKEISEIQNAMAIVNESRYDENLKIENIEVNNKLECINSEMREFVETGMVGTELRALTPPAAKMNATDTTGVGSVIIPTVLSNRIIQWLEEHSMAFAECTKFPTVQGKFQITYDDEEVANKYAIIVDEKTEFNDFKDLKFRKKELDQLRLVSSYSLTQHLLNDSAYDLVPYCTEKLAVKIARAIEDQIFNGTGTKQFTGILKDTNVAKVTTAVAKTISMDDLVAVYTSMNPSFLNGAKWYMARKAYNDICLLKDAQGNYFVQNGMVNGKLTKTLLGMAIEVTDCIAYDGANSAAQSGVVLANMKEAYAMMIKKDMVLKHVFNDTIQSLQGTHLLLLEMYCDGTVFNEQAVIKLETKNA
ncbi:MAG: phage major capsid protein [Clostridium sp.]|uniref:phage major capsid protein n=1 Tax=Clostridium sp. TaxID=1506 RepID=UPI003F390614